jgi:riboflavin synthase|tara:strand:+ start:4518 stop:5105 length:588 start_codon:yes stop_codon:yes gene_type:complete
MFTGIIESIGKIESLNTNGGDIQVSVQYDINKLKKLELGESISVNGVCLTLVNFDDINLKFDVSSESLANINSFRVQDYVNLETSLKFNGKISGHFVFGHVDGIAELIDINQKDGCEVWAIKIPNSLIKYIAKKGSISINGVSLTINEINNDIFKINLVPFTLEHTSFKFNKINDSLNIEIDMLARYVETILAKN